ARFEKSWASPIPVWTTSKRCAASATSSPVRRKSRPTRSGAVDNEKSFSEDFSFLLGGPGPVRGSCHPDHCGDARTRRVGRLGRATSRCPQQGGAGVRTRRPGRDAALL